MMWQARVTKERDEKLGRKKKKGLRPRSGEAEIDIRWDRGGVVSKELSSRTHHFQEPEVRSGRTSNPVRRQGRPGGLECGLERRMRGELG